MTSWFSSHKEEVKTSDSIQNCKGLNKRVKRHKLGKKCPKITIHKYCKDANPISDKIEKIPTIIQDADSALQYNRTNIMINISQGSNSLQIPPVLFQSHSYDPYMFLNIWIALVAFQMIFKALYKLMFLAFCCHKRKSRKSFSKISLEFIHKENDTIAKKSIGLNNLAAEAISIQTEEIHAVENSVQTESLKSKYFPKETQTDHEEETFINESSFKEEYGNAHVDYYDTDTDLIDEEIEEPLPILSAKMPYSNKSELDIIRDKLEGIYFKKFLEDKAKYIEGAPLGYSLSFDHNF
eukprot:NODE_9_length_64580_cov_1.431941.p29 type:complete len:295 gc:universal NODE_9_length_64580_cov_1.431941:14828-13944(-)